MWRCCLWDSAWAEFTDSGLSQGQEGKGEVGMLCRNIPADWRDVMVLPTIPQ